MTNEQLVAQIKAGEDVQKNMEQLYLQVRDYIHSVAMKYRNSGEVEDLEQEGYLALHAAIEKYDPGQGFKFLTYAALPAGEWELPASAGPLPGEDTEVQPVLSIVQDGAWQETHGY